MYNQLNGGSKATHGDLYINYGSQANDTYVQGVKVVVKSSGNVGIGTPTPNNKLGIFAAPNQEITTFVANSAAGIGDFAIGGVGWRFSRPNDGALAHGIYSYNSTGGAKANLAISSRSDIVFTAGNSDPSAPPERMRITETGNVGIGATNPNTMLEIGGRMTGRRKRDQVLGFNILSAPSRRPYQPVILIYKT